MIPCRLCGLKHNGNWTCQSWKDMLYSEDVATNHVLGKFCKKWQHCYKCHYIKHPLKVLRHFSGRCVGRKNNKCPVCYERRQPNYNKNQYSKIERQAIVVHLYYAMLLGECKNWRK